MADFSVQIANYKNYGTYDFKFDNVGNEILNPSSSIFQQVYFIIPFGNVIYNNSKLLSFYDPVFKEFIPFTGSSEVSVFPQEAIDEINAITYDNIQLQNQLQNFINMSEQDSGAADIEAVRNIIIGLRIQLGQGIMATDFDTVFPYLPIPIELKDTTTGVQVSPFSALSTIQPTVTTTTTVTSNTEQPATSTTPNTVELTDSERLAISASSTVADNSVNVPSVSKGNLKYVIPSMQFGSSVINGVTYYRVIMIDFTSPSAFSSIRRSTGQSFGSPANSRDVGTPLHGQYVNMTLNQIKSIQDDLTASKTVVIGGITYKSITSYAMKYWTQQDAGIVARNGNSLLQNWERYNGPNMLLGARRWTRSEQIGYIGALGPA